MLGLLASSQVAAAATATLYVRPSGNDGNPCSRARPCASFDRAYHAAAPGDVVSVGAGRYPGQRLTGAGRRSGRYVRFVARRGVTLGGDLSIFGATRAEFDNMTIHGWYVAEGSDHIRLRNVTDVGGLDINSADNVSWIGGSMGPGQNWDPEIKAAEGSTHPPTNILFDHVRFHDWVRNHSSAHVDCLHVMAVNGLTIRNSVFYNCEAFDLIFTHYGDAGEPSSVTLENNWFQCCRSGYYSIYVGNLNHGTIRMNSADSPPFVEFTNNVATGGDVRNLTIDSNIWPSISPSLCGQPGSAWDRNLVGHGASCAHGFRGDPLFISDRTGVPAPGVAAIPPDFRVRSGSPALAHGIGDPAQPSRCALVPGWRVRSRCR